MLDALVHERLIAEAYFGFRRMHVHIHAVGGNLDEEVDLGTALLDRGVAVRVDNRVGNRPILHDAAVHEHVLRPSRRSLLGEGSHEAFDAEPRQRLAHRHQVGTLAEDLKQPIFELRDNGPVGEGAGPARQGESDFRVAERKLRHHPRHLRGFTRVGLEKLPARRQVVEEVADFDGRAFGSADLLNRGNRAAVDPDLGPRDLAAQTALHDEMRDRRNAGQGFAAEAERVDGRQIVCPPDLARRVTLERQARILRAHALAVVLDPHETLPAQLDVDLNAPRAGVDRVFDELLDDRGRPLDYFAGSNLVR